MRYLDDGLVVVGAVLIIAGVAMVSIPAGMIVAGVFVLAAGILVGLRRAGE